MAKGKKSKKGNNELNAVENVHAALVGLSPGERKRVVASVQALLDIPGVPPLVTDVAGSNRTNSSGRKTTGRKSTKSTARKSSARGGRRKSTTRKSTGRKSTKSTARRSSSRKSSGRRT